MTSIKDLLKKQQARNNTESFNDNPVLNNKKGLKINNSKSKIKPPPERIDITSNTQKILSDIEFQNKLGWSLTLRLLSIFKDKKLQENKSQADKDNEMQVLMDYVEFAKLINNDQQQEEGLGSITFLIAISKCALLQRDQINEQGKLIDDLRKKISILEANMNSEKK